MNKEQKEQKEQLTKLAENAYDECNYPLRSRHWTVKLMVDFHLSIVEQAERDAFNAARKYVHTTVFEFETFDDYKTGR
jgi:uncharacterized protein YozE (UPF0346 family)